MTTYQQHMYAAENPSAIHTIILADADVPVEILASADGSLQATYYESEKEQYDIDEADGTLTIRKRLSFRIGLFLPRRREPHIKLTLRLPADYAGDLSVTTADGPIAIHGVCVGALTAKTADGPIHVTQTHIAESAAITATDGSIHVGPLTAGGLSLKTTDGSIHLSCPRVATALACHTVDGAIKGVLAARPSDYTFAVRTIDGRSNIHSGGNGPVTCNLRTVDGKISLSFEDEG